MITTINKYEEKKLNCKACMENLVLFVGPFSVHQQKEKVDEQKQEQKEEKEKARLKKNVSTQIHQDVKINDIVVLQPQFDDDLKIGVKVTSFGGGQTNQEINGTVVFVFGSFLSSSSFENKQISEKKDQSTNKDLCLKCRNRLSRKESNIIPLYSCVQFFHENIQNVIL